MPQSYCPQAACRSDRRTSSDLGASARVRRSISVPTLAVCRRRARADARMRKPQAGSPSGAQASRRFLPVATVRISSRRDAPKRLCAFPAPGAAVLPDGALGEHCRTEEAGFRCSQPPAHDVDSPLQAYPFLVRRSCSLLPSGGELVASCVVIRQHRPIDHKGRLRTRLLMCPIPIRDQCSYRPSFVGIAATSNRDNRTGTCQTGCMYRPGCMGRSVEGSRSHSCRNTTMDSTGRWDRPSSAVYCVGTRTD